MGNVILSKNFNFLHRRKTGQFPDPAIRHLGRIWHCSNNSLGMFTRWRSNCWGDGTSHHCDVHHLWCCIFLLSDKNARETDAWIGRHLRTFSSGKIQIKKSESCTCNLILMVTIAKWISIIICLFIYFQWWHVLIFFALLFWHQTGLKFALFRLKHGCLADGNANSDIIKEDDLNELAISFWPF